MQTSTHFVSQLAFGGSVVLLVTTLLPRVARACPSCATSGEVWEQITQQAPISTLVTLTMAFVIVAALIVLTARLMHRARLLLGGALLLGAGMGAFFDGILFHQVLQWHAMISSVLPPNDFVSSKVNMFWDGIFHGFSWISVVVGVGILVDQVPLYRPPLRRRAVMGGALVGWGFFNFVEGIVDHHVVGLHHVHPGFDEALWDYGFLASGVALVVLGAALFLPKLRGQEVDTQV